MPYIKKERRDELQCDLGNLMSQLANMGSSPGDLNFCITEMVKDFVIENQGNYAAFNAAIGVLECAKQELYRRMVAPYEDKKIKENGDVY